MRVLVIDDESILLTQLGEYLTAKGFVVTTADDGKSGWDIFTQTPNNFDAILSDIKMPVWSGLKLLERLRRDNYEVPVIFMTGHGEMQTCIDALQLGAYDFILKPFKLNVLKEALDRLKSFQQPVLQMNELLPQVRIELEIPVQSNTDLISPIIQYLQSYFDSFCKLHGIDSYKIGLSLTEALTNAIVHGNLEVDSSLRDESYDLYMDMIHERETDPEYAQRQALLRCRINPQYIEFEIHDAGKGFKWNSLPLYKPLDLIAHGRGLVIIQMTMTETKWNDQGNCITMRKLFK